MILEYRKLKTGQIVFSHETGKYSLVLGTPLYENLTHLTDRDFYSLNLTSLKMRIALVEIPVLYPEEKDILDLFTKPLKGADIEFVKLESLNETIHSMYDKETKAWMLKSMLSKKKLKKRLSGIGEPAENWKIIEKEFSDTQTKQFDMNRQIKEKIKNQDYVKKPFCNGGLYILYPFRGWIRIYACIDGLFCEMSNTLLLTKKFRKRLSDGIYIGYDDVNLKDDLYDLGLNIFDITYNKAMYEEF